MEFLALRDLLYPQSDQDTGFDFWKEVLKVLETDDKLFHEARFDARRWRWHLPGVHQWLSLDAVLPHNEPGPPRPVPPLVARLGVSKSRTLHHARKPNKTIETIVSTPNTITNH